MDGAFHHDLNPDWVTGAVQTDPKLHKIAAIVRMADMSIISMGFNNMHE